ncbi:MAG TPA: aldolase/citrate lyase family protein [Chloroflexota bacterium]|nr:aldolase/citrate lyase family protein [Chloroflexota bacterium]
MAVQTRRLNKTVQLLAQGQPIYYTSVQDRSYEGGRAAAQTWADYINVDMEHHAFDLTQLHEFMRGLVDGGPTPSGHRTPAVIVTLPTNGSDEQAFRANEWMVRQALAVGIHGILLCHAESPAAVKAFVESTRYPFQKIGRDRLAEGRRGSGGQAQAAAIWGLEVDEYLRVADPWPLNPEGELLLGLKIENLRALANAEAVAAVPGIAFAEWGPGDMGMSLGMPDAHDPPYGPEMLAARARVLAACKANKLAFLEQVTPENVTQQIDAGVLVGAGRNAEAAAAIGRAYTNRPKPW